MGCDGGTIPRRRELVRLKRKPEPKDPSGHANFQWGCCNLSQERLQRPIVACGLGKLYNKTAIIGALIAKRAPKHIRGLRDVRELNLTPNSDHGDDSKAAPYICPVTALEMDGRHLFVALWSCGCVVSGKALREIGAGTCPKCQQPFADADVLILNDERPVRRRMEIRILARKTRKLSQH